MLSKTLVSTPTSVDGGVVGAYRSNYANVLTEASWEASCSVLSIREVLISASVQGELKVFQVESQLQDRLIGSTVDRWQGIGSLLDWSSYGRGHESS